LGLSWSRKRFLDIPLNATGIRQAELLAESLKDVPIDVFISSPLKRAFVTTEKCAQLHGKEIAYTDDRLKEINFGLWAGMHKMANCTNSTLKIYPNPPGTGFSPMPGDWGIFIAS